MLSELLIMVKEITYLKKKHKITTHPATVTVTSQMLFFRKKANKRKWLTKPGQ